VFQDPRDARAGACGCWKTIVELNIVDHAATERLGGRKKNILQPIADAVGPSRRKPNSAFVAAMDDVLESTRGHTIQIASGLRETRHQKGKILALRRAWRSRGKKGRPAR